MREIISFVTSFSNPSIPRETFEYEKDMVIGKLRPVSYMAVAANSPGRIHLTVEVLYKTGIYSVHTLNTF
jgi:hypothetical protein